MKIVLGYIGVVLVMATIFLFVGFSVSYILIFVNFAGPQSIVEPGFEIGFSLGLICALAAGFSLVAISGVSIPKANLSESDSFQGGEQAVSASRGL
jgi:hypothetical protein